MNEASESRTPDPLANPTELLSDEVIIRTMLKYGGGFAKALSEAALRADDINLHRIKTTWPDYWKDYSVLAAKINARGSREPEK